MRFDRNERSWFWTLQLVGWEVYGLRIHLSTILNLEYVDRVGPWSNYSYRVFVRSSSEPLMMSRRYAALAKGRLG